MWWLLPLLILAVLVQALALPGLVTNGIRPDLPLVVVLGWASIRGWEQAVVAAVVGGIAGDLISAAPFGVNTVRLAALALLVGIATERMQRTSPILPIIAAGFGSLLGYVLNVLSLQAAGWTVGIDSTLFLVVLPSAVLTALCMAAAAPVLRALEERTRGEAEEPRVS